MKRALLVIGIFLAISFLIIGYDQFSSPQTYEDCILRNMKSVTSDAAAMAIRNSCRKKFPGAARSVRVGPEPRFLTPSEVAALEIETYSWGKGCWVKIYNGIRNVTASGMEISVPASTTKADHWRRYRKSFQISSFSHSLLELHELPEGSKCDNSSWRIESVWGIEE